MIKSIKIPENINIKILKKNNINLIILKNNSSELIESRELFFISKYNIFINNRIVLSNKHTINIIKQGINNLNL
jgi:ribonucleotide monophosphatase NagD (HAD superfamily)